MKSVRLTCTGVKQECIVAHAQDRHEWGAPAKIACVSGSSSGVEHLLPKQNVAGSNPVSRSIFQSGLSCSVGLFSLTHFIEDVLRESQ